MKTSNARLLDMPLDIRPFLHDIESSPDERSIERALKLALRPLPEAWRDISSGDVLSSCADTGQIGPGNDVFLACIRRRQQFPGVFLSAIVFGDAP